MYFVYFFQSWNALCYVTKTLDTTELHNYVNDIRQAVRFAVADLKYHQHQNSDLMPGFCLPKGITPILPIFRWVIWQIFERRQLILVIHFWTFKNYFFKFFRETILNGSPDMKEAAATGLGEVIKLTSSEALKPSGIIL